ncbi:hypothetical protein ACJX0J_023651, partial [Zea mays]
YICSCVLTIGDIKGGNNCDFGNIKEITPSDSVLYTTEHIIVYILIHFIAG